MYPFLKPGDRVVIKRAAQDSLQVGDIIVTPSKSQTHAVVHRIIKILPPDGCITKGDALFNPDPELILFSNVSGMVTAILRGNRVIPLNSGIRRRLKKLYVFLSITRLNFATFKQQVKNLYVRIKPPR
jgi:signal peptidase I